MRDYVREEQVLLGLTHMCRVISFHHRVTKVGKDREKRRKGGGEEKEGYGTLLLARFLKTSNLIPFLLFGAP